MSSAAAPHQGRPPNTSRRVQPSDGYPSRTARADGKPPSRPAGKPPPWPRDATKVARDATAVAFVSQRSWRAQLGRRISAGHCPQAGTYARLRPWWGRQHWLEQVVRAELDRAGRRIFYRRALPATVYAVARGMAEHADHRTGRRCRPTNERLAVELGMAVRTVQRCRAILKQLGLVVEVVPGRTNMTLDQRLVAHGRGSSHRALAAEFALVVPAGWRSLRDASRRPAVDGVTPPVGALESGYLTRSGSSVESGRPRKEPLRGAQHRRPTRPASPGAITTRRVLRELQMHAPWLRGSLPRLERCAARFVAHGWVARDFELHFRDRLARVDRSMPGVVDCPWGLFAWMMRDADPADRPTAIEDAMAEQQRRLRALAAWQAAAAECEHGVAGGDRPNPVDGRVLCPHCRRAARDTSPAAAVPRDEYSRDGFGDRP